MSARNTGGSKSAKNSQGRAPGGGGFAKSGKPRPGTGGYGKDKLAGKGPTPPAEMRPGHPAQRAAIRAAKAAGAAKAVGAAKSAGAARPAAGGRPASRTPSAADRFEPGSQDRRPERRERRDDVPEMVAGRNPVVESLRATVPAMALYVTGRAQEDERVAEAVQLAADTGIAVLETSMFELDRLTGNAVHQGVALRIRPYEYAHPDDLLTERTRQASPLIVALDGVTDPRNLGAIVRSAAAFGASGVLVPARRSAHVTAGAWKASAGALARLPVAQCSNLTRTVEAYKQKGLFVAGLDAEGTVDVHEMTIADGPMVLVVGSEGRGLSRIVASACDMLVSIPMSSGMESLNAGIAASIALYEIATVRARAAG
jgi:23S rRNA (guanosine2251-2'-O)-methyltransferase